MKDYAIYNEELDRGEKKEIKKYFITGYTIDGDEIIINYASKKKDILSNTKENEEKILNMMEKQLEQADEDNFEKNIEVDLEEDGLLAGMAFGTCVATLIPSILGVKIFGSIVGLFICPIAIGTSLICGVTGLYFLGKAIKEKKYLKDYKKSKFFLDNKKYLNENVKDKDGKIKVNTITHLSKKKTEELIVRDQNQPVFDINSIDSFSLRDLKQIKKNIDEILGKEEIFGSSYQGTIDKKPKALGSYPKK